MNATEIRPLAKLAQDEALALLGTQEVGRLVYTRHALPAVTPVNFALRDGAVWIWTASSPSMWQAVRGAVVGFEVDHLDAGTKTGWSVLVLGVAELVVAPRELERARSLGPEPWVSGRKEHLIRIPLTQISGRRIEPPTDHADVPPLPDDDPAFAQAAP